MNDLLREKLEKLPDLPGCYLMKDVSGKVIYVGKAISLKNRVRSYFRTPLPNAKTEALVEKIYDFDTVIVGNEREALILEANLIRRYDPHYNILLRDDKHYPYLRLTMEEDFPRLIVARYTEDNGSRYFGPYTNAGSMSRVLQIIQQHFPLRSCSGKSWHAGHRACLNAHIGRCKAPCVGAISKEEYAKIVEQVKLFLQGRTTELIRHTEAEMKQAAEELRFEEAARLRDVLKTLKELQTKQVLDQRLAGDDCDLIAVAAEDDLAVVQVFNMRSGAVAGRGHYFLHNHGGAEEKELLCRFLLDHYGGANRIPPRLYLPQLPDEADTLAELFSETAGHKVQLVVPQRGDKKRLLHLVEENAARHIENEMTSKLRQQSRNAAGLESLRLALNLPKTPRRIECFDISHIQGTDMVGSMVVFIDGAAAPKKYRRFKIKTLDGSNDFAALQEVLHRRWQRGLDEKAQGKEPPDFADFPDLLVIDGGKGQLSSVCYELSKFDVALPPIISLAEKQEEIFLPGESEPLLLPFEDPGLQLLQRLRDEAHRFAITFHRQLRGKRQVKSELDSIPGIGPKRRQALRAAYKSLAEMRKATLDELESVPGMTRPAAENVYLWLQNTAKDGEK